MSRLAAPLACVLLAGGCIVSERRGPLDSESTAVIRRGVPSRAWRVMAGEREVGCVVFFESTAWPEDSLYVVRNPWQQDLGVIDSKGRAYRYVPHLEEPQWVGTGTVAEGAARVLHADLPCALVEMALPPTPADDGG